MDGTLIGFNLPDSKGNRYSINSVSIDGYPMEGEEEVEKSKKVKENDMKFDGSESVDEMIKGN